jgi:hypothetical protein
MDADEDSLVPRLLCAALHQATDQPSLALLQYETLLPLAVGQGDFLRAIAVQKHLDALHPASVSHARRFEALHRWFSAIRPRKPKRDQPLRSEDLTIETLLDLDPRTFTRLVEAATLEGLDPEPRALESQAGSARLVVYGRAHWSLTRADDVLLLEGVAEAGDPIAVSREVGPDVRLTIHAELPAEFLCVDAQVFAALNGEELQEENDFSVPPIEPAEVSVIEVAEDEIAPDESPVLGEPFAQYAAADDEFSEVAKDPVVPRAAPPVPASPLRPRAPGPRPDARFEPTMAVSAPVSRRRETRISVNLHSAIARLGIADTRTSPIQGRMLHVTESYLELAFPRSELHHMRGRLEKSYVSLRLALDTRQSLACVSRVRWTSAFDGGAEGVELRLELEFMPMAPQDKARLVEAVRLLDARGSDLPSADAA